MASPIEQARGKQFSIKAIGRSGDLLDVAVDHVGVAIGMLATWRWWVQGKP